MTSVSEPTVDAPDAKRETLVLGLVSFAHLVSHYYMLILPPLFPFLMLRLNTGYVELGFAMTLFGITSAVTQAPIGYAVDRYGARPLLIAGLILGGLAYGSFAFVPTYPWLLVVAVLAGLANSVYHPADYSILSHTMSPSRMGRAFSIHTFAGHIGFAVAPPILILTATKISLEAAFLVTGIIGLLTGVLLFAPRFPVGAPSKAKSGTPMPSVSLRNPVILNLTLFFLLLVMATNGVSSFSVAALTQGYGVDITLASTALTAFLTFSGFGVLAGGWLADQTKRHGDVAAIGFSLTALVILFIALAAPGPVMLVLAMSLAGFLSGLIAPSRDMMVREAAPKGAEGRVFGIVSTGFNVGVAAAPLLFGYVMDLGYPRWIFGGVVLFMLLAVAQSFVARQRIVVD